VKAIAPTGLGALFGEGMDLVGFGKKDIDDESKISSKES